MRGMMPVHVLSRRAGAFWRSQLTHHDPLSHLQSPRCSRALRVSAAAGARGDWGRAAARLVHF